MATWRDDVMPWSDVRLGRTGGGGPSRVGTGHFPFRADECRQRDGRARPERFHAVLPQRRPRQKNSPSSPTDRERVNLSTTDTLGRQLGDIGRRLGRHVETGRKTAPSLRDHHMSLRRLCGGAGDPSTAPGLDPTRAPPSETLLARRRLVATFDKRVIRSEEGSRCLI